MSNTKQQLNVYLDSNLIKAIKHRAIDEDRSLSNLVTDALTNYLTSTNPPAN